ncbi:hypothetical protein V6N13_005880 [Hibiscus sabdariffa]
MSSFDVLLSMLLLRVGEKEGRKAFSAASCSSSDDDRKYVEPSNSQNWRQVDEDFRVRGSGHFTLRKRRSNIDDLFSWAEELTGGKSVVKLWDNLRLGFCLDLDESDNVLNVYDVNRVAKIGSFFWGEGRVSGGFNAVFVVTSSSRIRRR